MRSLIRKIGLLKNTWTVILSGPCIALFLLMRVVRPTFRSSCDFIPKGYTTLYGIVQWMKPSFLAQRLYYLTLFQDYTLHMVRQTVTYDVHRLGCINLLAVTAIILAINL